VDGGDRKTMIFVRKIYTPSNFLTHFSSKNRIKFSVPDCPLAGHTIPGREVKDHQTGESNP